MSLLAEFEACRYGTVDIFGRTEAAKAERALIVEYTALMEKLAAGLNADNLEQAIALASLPERITRDWPCQRKKKGHAGVSCREGGFAEASKYNSEQYVTSRERDVHIKKMYCWSDGNAHFDDLAHILFDQALLAEGGQLEDPAAYVKRVNALLVG